MIRKNRFSLILGAIFALPGSYFLHAEEQSPSRFEWINIFKSYATTFISKGPITNIKGIGTTFASGALTGSIAGGISFLACKDILKGVNTLGWPKDTIGILMAFIIGTIELYICDRLTQQLHDNLMNDDNIKENKFVEMHFHLFATMFLLFSGTTFSALSCVNNK